MGKKRENDVESPRRGPQGWWTKGFLGRSDWEIVRLPKVLPEKGWREYFLGEQADGKAAA